MKDEYNKLFRMMIENIFSKEDKEYILDYLEVTNTYIDKIDCDVIFYLYKGSCTYGDYSKDELIDIIQNHIYKIEVHTDTTIREVITKRVIRLTNLTVELLNYFDIEKYGKDNINFDRYIQRGVNVYEIL